MLTISNLRNCYQCRYTSFFCFWQDSGLLKQSGPYKGFQSSVLINTHDYANSKAALTTFGARQSTTAGSVYHQIPVSAELVPISDALNWAHWKPVTKPIPSIIFTKILLSKGKRSKEHTKTFIFTLLNVYWCKLDSLIFFNTFDLLHQTHSR